VILGEGDSEEIVLPRLLKAKGLAEDETSILVAPLGGRHVNHFWRLLNGLQIPHVTLLDLDLGRNQAGWGRVKYAAKQLLALGIPIQNLTASAIDALPAWNGSDDVSSSNRGQGWKAALEARGIFFSSPLDLDYAMLVKFPAAYDVSGSDLVAPDLPVLVSVLGKASSGPQHFSEAEQAYFATYHSLFKVGSKPAAHLHALARLTDEQLVAAMPESFARLIAFVEQRLRGLPE
jgi:putative ATP-dependent endonuclease of OLD family